MNKNIIKYFNILKNVYAKVVVTSSKGDICSLQRGIEMALGIIDKQVKAGGKLIFIGNGASASISSHMATDFWKNAGIKAISFNDSSLLTCVSNDYGFKYVFEKPIEMFAQPGDVLIAISSSGKSENILRGVSAASKKKLKIFTLSGFRKDNPLRRLGVLNFYVPEMDYGFVETAHSGICHCLVDMIMLNKNG